jgi:hypothetical protein
MGIPATDILQEPDRCIAVPDDSSHQDVQVSAFLERRICRVQGTLVGANGILAVAFISDHRDLDFFAGMGFSKAFPRANRRSVAH